MPAERKKPTPRAKRSTSKLDSLGEVQPADRAAWRRWLAKHHATSPGIWLIFEKKSAGADRLPYVDAVEEALCFGWIDSLTRSIDDRRYRQLYTPRKPRSAWSRPNKERVARLIEGGLMQPAGLAAIDLAKKNGMWTVYDGVDALEMPPDLAAAFRRNAAARRNYDAMSASVRKAYLYWVLNAKRPETRKRRIADVVARAARNQKPGMSD